MLAPGTDFETRRTAEAEEQEKPVRFDSPAGASADSIAEALNRARKRLMAEYAAKQKKDQEQPERD
jgi:hypothetical protein